MSEHSKDDEDRAAALSLVPVPRETATDFAVYVDRLRAWQRIKNLVAPSTLDHVWTRHLADSAQLLALAEGRRRWVDLGSGAGFPGLVIAIMLKGQGDAVVHLVESNGRKCAFLREVARATGAPVEVHADRIESVMPKLPADIQVVSSRALAPLPALIDWSRSLLDCGAIGLFLSGEEGTDSFDPVQTSPYAIDTVPSRTRPSARIIRVTRRDV